MKRFESIDEYWLDMMDSKREIFKPYIIFMVYKAKLYITDNERETIDGVNVADVFFLLDKMTLISDKYKDNHEKVEILTSVHDLLILITKSNTLVYSWSKEFPQYMSNMFNNFMGLVFFGFSALIHFIFDIQFECIFEQINTLL